MPITMIMRLKHTATNSLWLYLPNSKITQQNIRHTNPMIELNHPSNQNDTTAYTPTTNTQSAHPINMDIRVRYTPTEYVLPAILFGFNRIYEKQKYIKHSDIDENFTKINHPGISHNFRIFPQVNIHPKNISIFFMRLIENYLLK
jgi:hypothetical protein